MKNMKVSWDDDIPNIWKKHEKTNVSKHQPEISKDLWARKDKNCALLNETHVCKKNMVRIRIPDK